MKIVPDATVLIRAHNRSRALARRLLHEILELGHRLVLSNEMIVEVVKVLRYPHFQNLYGLTEADLLEYTQFLQSVADIVILDPQYRAPFLRDPNDVGVQRSAARRTSCVRMTGISTMMRCCRSVQRVGSRCPLKARC